jgi:hypothetical protein
MTARELEEYRELRSTIRERGSARVWLMAVGILAWAGLVILTAALLALPVATFISLVALAAVFEGVLSLHTGAERVGRYIQVFHESDAADPGWEQRIMEFGRRFPGGGDPLFCLVFWCAAILNMIPALYASPVPVEWAFVGSGHAVFVFRVAIARSHSRKQRARDLEHFSALKKNPEPR